MRANQFTGVTTEERFWAKVEITEGCWLWTASKSSDGYGQFRVGGVIRGAHRYAYELLVGPIPEGLDVDHLCHNEDPFCPGGPTCIHRRCMNPAHLEPVTPMENMIRGKSLMASAIRTNTCKHGHSLLDAYQYQHGRVCRTCKALRDAKRDYSKKRRGKKVKS